MNLFNPNQAPEPQLNAHEKPLVDTRLLVIDKSCELIGLYVGELRAKAVNQRMPQAIAAQAIEQYGGPQFQAYSTEALQPENLTAANEVGPDDTKTNFDLAS